MLGHSSTAITERVYTSVFEDVGVQSRRVSCRAGSRGRSVRQRPSLGGTGVRTAGVDELVKG